MGARQPQGPGQQLQALRGAERQRLLLLAPHTPTGGGTMEGLFPQTLRQAGWRGWWAGWGKWWKPQLQLHRSLHERAVGSKLLAEGSPPQLGNLCCRSQGSDWHLPHFPRIPPALFPTDSPNGLQGPQAQLLGTALVFRHKSLNIPAPHCMTVCFLLSCPALSPQD